MQQEVEAAVLQRVLLFQAGEVLGDETEVGLDGTVIFGMVGMVVWITRVSSEELLEDVPWENMRG